MKKKLLIIGIDMRLAGTEKSLLTYLKRYDPDCYDITLLLAEKKGLLLSELPKYINVVEMPRPYGKIFLIDKNSAKSTLLKTVALRHPSTSAKLLAQHTKKKQIGKADTMELWCEFMKLMPPLDGYYDEAIAYWGEKTMFYMLEKVNAGKKVVRQHFSYTHTKYSEPLYYEAYKKCDYVEHVASSINDEFCTLFPDIANKAAFVPNEIFAEKIQELADADIGFDDNFRGSRILTVARLCSQKGLFGAAQAIGKLSKCADVRWYIIGVGEEGENLRKFISYNSLEERIVLLGEKSNPYPYMKQCDIYFQPSRFEGMPLTVEEAKVLNKPIVACDYLSAAEQLEHYENSIICKKDDHDICDALLTLIKNTKVKNLV